MFWIILGIGLILMGFGLWGCYNEYNGRVSEGQKRRLRFDFACDAGYLFWVPAVILMLMCFLAWPLIYLSFVGDLAKLEAFYDASAQNYAYAVDETAAYLSLDDLIEGGVFVEGSIEKFKLADSVSQRIAEYRDRTSDYNQQLTTIRKFDSHWMISAFVPTPSEHLKLIVLK